MRRTLLPVVLCSSVLLFDVDLALAKKGGGGRGPSGPSKSSRPSLQPKQQPRIINSTAGSPLHRRSDIQLSTRNRGNQTVEWTPKADPRLGNEERKLDHRLQTAQHLRENSARNGNANLLNTADRMEQRAYEHYDSRLGRLGGNTAEVDLTGSAPESVVPGDDITAIPQTSPTQLALGGQRGLYSSEDSLGSDFQPLDSAA